MQSLGLDVRVLSEDDREVDIKETTEFEDFPQHLGERDELLATLNQEGGAIIEDVEIDIEDLVIDSLEESEVKEESSGDDAEELLVDDLVDEE